MPRNFYFSKSEILQIYHLKARGLKDVDIERKTSTAGLVFTQFCQKVTILEQNYILGNQRKQLNSKTEKFSD